MCSVSSSTFLLTKICFNISSAFAYESRLKKLTHNFSPDRNPFPQRISPHYKPSECGYVVFYPNVFRSNFTAPKFEKMKNEKQQQARNLYFRTNLKKTEIAEILDVDRRTIYQWSVDGNWERLKMSSNSMPIVLAEKCYYLVGHFTDHLLSRGSIDGAMARSDAETLYKLVLSIGKLRKGSTVNENMEAFTYFLESIKKKDPALAEQVLPHFEEYITQRKDLTETSFLPDGYTKDGWMQPAPPAGQVKDKQPDEVDMEQVLKDLHELTETLNDMRPHAA
jgi:DNA-binding XRE family transcriptional regulator